MQRFAASTLALLVALALAPLGAGCPGDPPPTRVDAGARLDAAAPVDAVVTHADGARPDARTTEPCGDVGQACCGATGVCSAGRRCESELCCAVPGGGVACDEPSDCCGDADCVGGACCSLQGAACRSSAECCSDLLCQGGVCSRPADDCGRDGGACCPGDECRSGSVCSGGRCETCGGDGELCCAPPRECAAGLSCQGGRCRTPDPACGAEGQPCCAGERCEGDLSCTGGTCATPTTECDYADCGECTAHYPCGFCGETGRCSVGTSGGPSTGSCGSWAWLRSQCTGSSDPCASATTCADCTARAGCGFCDGQCRGGTASGASGYTCTGSWSWLSSQCGGSTDTCASYTDCESCTAHYPCGFCDGACRSGTSSGPSTGSCGSWAWLSSSCPSVDTCSDATTCGACTGRAACGYCASSATCMTGGPSGPDRGSCANWDYVASDCACSPVAGACASNAECCDALSCRRGATYGVRCCVEASGTCRSGTDCCGYMDCVSGRCTCRAAGRGCLENADCCSGSCAAGRCT